MFEFDNSVSQENHKSLGWVNFWCLALNLTNSSFFSCHQWEKNLGVSNFQTDFHMCKVGQDLRELQVQEKGVVNPVNLGF